MIERLENFHLFSKLLLYAMYTCIPKIATCVFLLFFLFDLIWGKFDAGGDIPARVRSIKFSLSLMMQFLFFLILKTKRKIVVHRVNQFFFSFVHLKQFPKVGLIGLRIIFWVVLGGRRPL